MQLGHHTFFSLYTDWHVNQLCMLTCTCMCMPKATELPLLTPPLSTVDWFHIKKYNNHGRKNFVQIVVTFEPILQI